MLKHTPNLITVCRILCVPLLAIWILREDYPEALFLALLMGLSDACDGFLAKRFAWHSQVGALLDPVADKCMLVVACYSLGLLGLVPDWLVATIIVRDLMILGGVVSLRLLLGRFEMAPSNVSKFNTCAQLVMVFTVLLSQIQPSWAPLWTPLLEFMFFAVAGTTIVSGGGYVLTWSERAWRKNMPAA